jgi:hypothetical protein
MRVTKKDLLIVLSKIATLENEAINRNEAIEKGKDKFYDLEYDKNYGGYRVVKVDINSYAHYGAFNGSGTESRISAREMLTKLQTILYNLKK